MALTRTAMRALRHPVKSVGQVRRNWPLLLELAKTRGNYSEAYRRFQNDRMAADPRASVGGWGQGIGRLQRDFLIREGLQPDNALLDIGCGTLRAGRYLIEYLDAGRYTGMDISEEALRQGEQLLDESRGSDYRLVSNFDLTFREFFADEFDYSLAQSVFTHIPKSDAEELLANLPRVLKPDGVFYATVNQPDRGDYSVAGVRTYRYSVGKIRELGAEKWAVEALGTKAYPHPGGQDMLKLTPL